MGDEWFRFSYQDFAFSFLSILLEGIPFVLLGTIISGLVDAFLPAGAMTRLLPRRPMPAILLSGGLGMVFPMCECGIVPVIRRLMGKGLPIACAIAYMLAAPIVNPVVALSTFAAFRGQEPMLMTGLRLGVGFLVAVAAAIVIGRLRPEWVLRKRILESLPKPVREGDGTVAKKVRKQRDWKTLRKKIGTAAAVTTSDFIDVAMYLVIGAAIAALFNTSVNQEVVLPLANDALLAIVSMMSLSALLSLCSTSDAFIAATLTFFPFASRLAFLVLGPMVDLKLIFLYAMVFRKRLVIGMCAGVFVLTGLICLRLHHMFLESVL